MQEPMYLEDQILTRLQRGPVTVKYLAKHFKVSQPFVLVLLSGLQQRKLVRKSGIQWVSDVAGLYPCQKSLAGADS